MTHHFSPQSLINLNTCDERLINLFLHIIKHVDCTIVEGYRGPVRQNKMVEDGLSRLQYPNGKHNQSPSQAVDAVPYPIDWKDYERFYWFGRYVLGAADTLGLEIRWGGDWDSDMDFKDQTLVDLVHFELQ